MTATLPPWPHQVTLRHLMKGKAAFYAAMEQRTGKTRPILEEAAELYQEGKINGLLIIAMPMGAPLNWVADEIPLWLDPTIPRHTYVWNAQKFKQKGHTEQRSKLISFSGLSILAINGEAIITENAKTFIKTFLTKRRVYVVGDELSLIAKTPGNQRSKVMHAITKYAPYRRALDGTPEETPMDLYSQYKFLDPSIFGFPTFFAFRNRYAVLETKHNWAQGHDYKTIKLDDDGKPIYQNLDELRDKIAPWTYRVLFKEVFKDVPEPVYSKHYFELHPDQRKAYDQLEEEYETELKGLGTVSVAHVLTRYLRLQQVASGYWPAQDNQAAICEKCQGEGCQHCADLGVLLTEIPLTRIIPFEENPRLEALKFELSRSSGQQIIWARFDQDVDDCLEACKRMGRRAVRYDGRDNSEAKFLAKQAFQNGEVDDIVCKQRAAGRALRLDKATGMVYYSNEFSLLQRLQSEMRAQTGDRRIATTITDLVAQQTLDDLKLIPALRMKKSLADVINRDPKGNWL